MPTIDRMTGVSTGDNYYLATVRANADGVTVTPMGGDKPVLKANAAPDTTVNPYLKRLLDKAGLAPPPTGQVLSISYVNKQLTEAKMTVDERCEAKAALIRMKMIEVGQPVNVFGS